MGGIGWEARGEQRSDCSTLAAWTSQAQRCGGPLRGLRTSDTRPNVLFVPSGGRVSAARRRRRQGRGAFARRCWRVNSRRRGRRSSDSVISWSTEKHGIPGPSRKSGNVAKAKGFPPEDWSDVPPGHQHRRRPRTPGLPPKAALPSEVGASADEAKWHTHRMRFGCSARLCRAAGLRPPMAAAQTLNPNRTRTFPKIFIMSIELLFEGQEPSHPRFRKRHKQLFSMSLTINTRQHL